MNSGDKGRLWFTMTGGLHALYRWRGEIVARQQKSVIKINGGGKPHEIPHCRCG